MFSLLNAGDPGTFMVYSFPAFLSHFKEYYGFQA